MLKRITWNNHLPSIKTTEYKDGNYIETQTPNKVYAFEVWQKRHVSCNKHDYIVTFGLWIIFDWTLLDK